jgi:predicted DNA-binding protein (MmcQ/YjbR family)
MGQQNKMSLLYDFYVPPTEREKLTSVNKYRDRIFVTYMKGNQQFIKLESDSCTYEISYIVLRRNVTTWNTQWRSQWLLQTEDIVLRNKINYNTRNVKIRCKIADYNMKREVRRPRSRQISFKNSEQWKIILSRSPPIGRTTYLNKTEWWSGHLGFWILFVSSSPHQTFPEPRNSFEIMLLLTYTGFNFM